MKMTPCLVCGIEFYQHAKYQRLTCSRTCWNELNARKKRGKHLTEETRNKQSDTMKGHAPQGKGAIKEGCKYAPKEEPDFVCPNCGVQHGLSHFWGKQCSEETKQKLRSVLGVAFNTQKEKIRRKEAAELGWRRGMYDGVFTSPTSIELKTFSLLDRLGIKYNKFHRINIGYKTRVIDAFIPPNICIEADGEYWHGESCHGKNVKEEDSKTDKSLRELGYVVCRIHEKKFEEDKYLGILEKIIRGVYV